jgi:hypothetical protein
MLGLSESTGTNDFFKTSKQTPITTRTNLSVQNILPSLQRQGRLKTFPEQRQQLRSGCPGASGFLGKKELLPQVTSYLCRFCRGVQLQSNLVHSVTQSAAYQCSAVCLTAQKDSSAGFASLGSHSSKENFGS